MNRLAIEQRIFDINTRLDELVAVAGERAWTDEEETEVGNLRTERTRLDGQLATIREEETRQRTMPGRQDQNTAAERRTAHVSVRELSDDNPNPWGPSIPANASEAERTRLLEVGFGNFLQAVAQAGTPGGVIDPRLMPRADVSGANTGTPSDGGFLVRTQYSDMLLNRSVASAVLAPLCDRIPIGDGFDGVEAPTIVETSRVTGSRWGGIQVYRRDEADTVTATKIKFGGFELRLEDMMGLAYATDRQLRDGSALGALLSRAFVSEFSWMLDEEIYRGNGAGRCLGVIADANSNKVSVTIESGQTLADGDGLVWENLTKMWARVPARLRGSAIWVYNQELEPALDQLAIPVGTGGLEPRFVVYGNDGILRIKGRPAIALEQASAPGTVGDIAVLCLNEYVLIDKDGIQAAESMHVRFIYGERTFRWVYSINGAPKFHSAITPAYGNNNLSPFVTLAARS